jgi:hypothetical protein
MVGIAPALEPLDVERLPEGVATYASVERKTDF